jgi:hypothetical protein
VSSAPGVFIYTGRQGEFTEFAEPEGAPSIYSKPGRFLVPLLASGRVNVVIVENQGLPIANEVAFVAGRCPQAFSRLPGLPGRPDSPRMYRLVDTNGCVSRLPGGR